MTDRPRTPADPASRATALPVPPLTYEDHTWHVTDEGAKGPNEYGTLSLLSAAPAWWTTSRTKPASR